MKKRSTRAKAPFERDDLKLGAKSLRWYCERDWLPFESTAEVEPAPGIVAQDDAIEALRYGLEVHGPGQNVFVRGLAGTGRLTLVRQLVETMRPACPEAPDRCYVHNFDHPGRPRLISLPRGQGRVFRDQIDQLIEFIRDDLARHLGSEVLRARRTALDDRTQEEIRTLGKPFEEELRHAELTLVPVEVGETLQPAIMPVIDGEPATPERFKQLRSEGKITDAQAEGFHTRIATVAKHFQALGEKIEEIQSRHRTEIQALYVDEARRVLGRRIQAVSTALPFEPVQQFLREVADDLVPHRLKSLQEDPEFTLMYRVNLVLAHEPGDACPVVIENAPTVLNLLGTVEREPAAGGEVRSDHRMIQAGSLLRADGGYLILDAREVLGEPGAWKVLLRTLRSRKLEIVPAELFLTWLGPLLKPEAIEINVKVVLIGDPEIYYMLDAYDPDFSQLFKVLADFETSIPRTEQSARFYAGVLSRIIRDESLPHFARGALLALVDYGARIAARRDRLTTRFGRLADIAREAAFLARKNKHELVDAEDVAVAVRRNKRRGDLPSRSFRRLVAEGTIRIVTQGSAVGQVNGLAVIHAGPIVYGFPTRITATIGAGSSGTINIEREAELSGSLRTKGFYILGGLLRHLLRTKHPLTFSASVAFEQSYGGIDGDSASGAEICCLLSALTGVPLRQDLAMTGAIDQHGHIQPVGAVTEKTEGFFDTCSDVGLTGTQGVILPRANAGELMLRRDVVRACEQGRFHVYAVETVQEALEIFTGMPAGAPGPRGNYPAGTLLRLAEQKAHEFWVLASVGPSGGVD